MTEIREPTVFNRCLVMKVSKFDIILSHFITQLPNVFLQICIVFPLSLITSDISKLENLVLIFIILCLTGICGMLLGVLVGIVGKTQNSISLIIFTISTIHFYLSPFYAQAEAMSPYIQPITRSLPLYYSFETLRFLMKHPAVAITHPKVIYSFISLLGWIFGSSILLILWIFIC